MTTLIATSVVRGSHQGESHGGVYLRGVLGKDAVSGIWSQNAYCCGAFGRFSMHRSDRRAVGVPLPPPAPPPPYVDSSQLGRFRVRVRDAQTGRFVAFNYVLFTPPESWLHANMQTAATNDGWGPTGYARPGKYAIELESFQCGTDDWFLEKRLRQPFATRRGELTDVEFSVRWSALKAAKAYYNPTGGRCPHPGP